MRECNRYYLYGFVPWSFMLVFGIAFGDTEISGWQFICVILVSFIALSCAMRGARIHGEDYPVGYGVSDENQRSNRGAW